MIAKPTALFAIAAGTLVSSSAFGRAAQESEAQFEALLTVSSMILERPIVAVREGVGCEHAKKVR